MPRRFLVFVAALVVAALAIAFTFLGSGATKNTVPGPEAGVQQTTR